MAPGSKAVFIGNIPFSEPVTSTSPRIGLMITDLSEEQIIAILEQVGKVLKFRLMTNPDTGKPKGFGFADYQTADEAASAVRNLNDYEVQGRKIRVDWPHNNEKESVPQNYDANAVAADINSAPPASAIPSLPPGIDLPPNLKASDAISQTLNTLPPQQLLDVLTSMKSLAISEPARATEILKQAPQLSYAIFQALILMNLVDPNILTQVIEQGANLAQSQVPRVVQPPPLIPPPPLPLAQIPQQYQPQQQYPSFPPPPIPNQFGSATQLPPRPPVYGTPQPPPIVSTPQPIASLTNEEMIRQILMMDQKTIDSLAPEQRIQVLQIRENALRQQVVR